MQPELASMAAWLAASPQRIAEIYAELAATLGPEWRPVDAVEVEVSRAHYGEWTASNLEDHYAALATPGRAAAPGLLYEPAKILFHVVPGGELQMGLSAEELAAITAEDLGLSSEELGVLDWSVPKMRPVRTVAMRPFLLASAPLVGHQLELLGWVRDPAIDRLFSSSDNEVTYVLVGEVPAALHGLRLPSEAEYEHACRAGTRTAFFWGNEIPDQPNEEPNPLGLVELGNHPELMADAWHDSYDGAPLDQQPWVVDSDLPRVSRGGAAGCYPWQGCGEWQLMLSSFRNSVEVTGDFPASRMQVALRLARDL